MSYVGSGLGARLTNVHPHQACQDELFAEFQQGPIWWRYRRELKKCGSNSACRAKAKTRMEVNPEYRSYKAEEARCGEKSPFAQGRGDRGLVNNPSAAIKCADKVRAKYEGAVRNTREFKRMDAACTSKNVLRDGGRDCKIASRRYALSIRKYQTALNNCYKRVLVPRKGVRFGAQGLGEYFSGIGASESGGFCAPDNAGMCFETPSARDTVQNFVQYGHTPDPAAWAHVDCPDNFVITDENVGKFRPDEVVRFPVCTNENYAAIVGQQPNFKRSSEEGEGGGSSSESEEDKKKKMYMIGGAAVLAVGGLAFFMSRKKKR